MSRAPLEVARDQVLAFRRATSHLDARLPPGADSLRRAAWAGLQDSMPRAALLSIHARVAATTADAWEHPSLTQLWGPRFSAYVVAEVDAPVFSLGRLPDEPAKRRFAQDTASRLEAFLDGRAMSYADAGCGLGVNPNMLRYGAPTGRIRIRWEGARRPTVWTVPGPAMDPLAARLELARRFLHVLGPSTAQGFSDWAGIRAPRAHAAFEGLGGELTPVRTPIGDAWLLASDEAAILATPGPTAPARLLPSGDTFYLLQGRERDLLVPDPRRRAELWTSRVWPGAVMVGGEVAGTWRRADAVVVVAPWRALSTDERQAVETEAAGLPLPGLDRPIRVTWAA